MNSLRTCKSTIIATFLAAATVSAVLPACEQGSMTCLAASGTYGAHFTTVSGDPACVGNEYQQIYINYFLGVTTEGVPRPDPFSPSIAVTMPAGRGARDAADNQLKAIANYENCATKGDYVPPQVDLSYQNEKFYSYSLFSSGEPDVNDQCFATQFAPANITTPPIPAVPKCDGDANSEAVPEYPGENVVYTVRDVSVKVKPAIQGQLVRGTIDYQKDGCSGTYNFVALNPAVPCENDGVCQESVKVNGELKAEVTCGIPAGETEGFCVYRGAL